MSILLPSAVAPGAAMHPVITVSQLNRLARQAVESGIPLSWVAGEVSNCKRYDSGHCYFTLKDAEAQVDCVIFRHKLSLLGWQPQNGMQIEVRSTATIYEARGKFQLNVETMRRSGLGALYEAFGRLKMKLEGEGLFDPDTKLSIPRFPRAIGIVTSPQAAALRDVLTTLRRRMPALPVILYPTPVQGDGAALKIAQAITTAAERAECDTLIVCRGGGSIEDLWAYNEEPVARAIAACALPVITGVGHETDFTIADFVADARAPTPTAAAALASPDRAELHGTLMHWAHRLSRVTSRALEERMQRADYLGRRLVHPGERIRHQSEQLGHLSSRLTGAWNRVSDARLWEYRALARQLVSARPELDGRFRQNAELAQRLRACTTHRLAALGMRLEGAEAHLKHLNPERVLERGYSIVSHHDEIVMNAAALSTGDELTIRFARGTTRATVRDNNE
jgi:exodeoxyribonuclease VII large subunit